MRIYLDVCCFNRPFDDQSQARIRLETEAKLLLQEYVREGKHELAWSYILDYEISRNPFQERVRSILDWRRLAGTVVHESSAVLRNAEVLMQNNVGVYDALHVACAIEAKSDVFVTTDDRLLKKLAVSPVIRAATPGAALAYIEKWYED